MNFILYLRKILEKYVAPLHSISLAKLIIEDEALATGNIDEMEVERFGEMLEAVNDGFEGLGYSLQQYDREDGKKQGEYHFSIFFKLYIFKSFCLSQKLKKICSAKHCGTVVTTNAY